MADLATDFIESNAIIEQSDFSNKLEGQLKDIAVNLFPELDWQNNPVIFKIADVPHVNASIYPHKSPAIIVLNKGLFDFVKTEDELAFIIGHELGHKDIRTKLDYQDRVTKGEEASADIISTLRLVKAGYSYNAGIDLFRRLEQKIRETSKDQVLGKISSVFDPHPYNENRIVAMQLALANENLFKSGNVEEVEDTPLRGLIADKNALLDVKHVSFLEGFLPSNYDDLSILEKVSALGDALSKTISSEQFIDTSYRRRLIRGNDIIDRLSKITAVDADDQVEIYNKLSAMVAEVHRMDPNNVYNKFDRFYTAASNIVKNDFDPFKSFGNAVDQFIDSTKNPKKAYIGIASSNLLYALSELGPYLSRTDGNNMSYSFDRRADMRRSSNALYGSSAMLRLQSFDLRPLYGLANDDEALAKAIWAIGGAFIDGFQEALGPDMLSRLLPVTPYLGYRRGNQETSRYEEYRDLKRKINARDALKIKENSKKNTKGFLDNPLAFIQAYEFDLFPKGSPQSPRAVVTKPVKDIISDFKTTASVDKKTSIAKVFQMAMAGFKSTNVLNTEEGPQSSVKEAQYKIINDIHIEIRSALISGNQAKVSQALDAVNMLLLSRNSHVESWMSSNGREDYYTSPRNFYRKSKKIAKEKSDPFFNARMTKSYGGQPRYDSYKLPLNHPFVDLFKDTSSYLSQEQRAAFIQNNIEYFDTNGETVRDLLGVDRMETLSEALALRNSTKSYSQLYDYIADEAIDSLLAENKKLSFSSGDFMSLIKFHGKLKGAEYKKILGPDGVDAIFTNLWNNYSPENLTSHLEGQDINSVVDIYQFMEAYKLYPDKGVNRDVVSIIKDRLDKEPSSPVKEKALNRLLFDQTSESEYDRTRYTVSDISLRDYAVTEYKKHILLNMGQDNGSVDFYNIAKKEIDKIITRSSKRDRRLMLEALADTIQIQEPLARYIKEKVAPSAEDLKETHFPIVGIESLLYSVQRDKPLREGLINYLSEPISVESVKALQKLIQKNKNLVQRMTSLEYLEVKDGCVELDRLADSRLGNSLSDLHDNFTALNIENKSAMISALLIPGDARLDAELEEIAYSEAMDMVLSKVFSTDIENGREAESFARAYIQTAHNFERPAILAALMVLSGESDKSKKISIADSASRIMSLLGPSYVKLGQAINSHPNSSESWKAATANLKSNSGIETRWETIVRTADLLSDISDTSADRSYLSVLGAASFNTAIEIKELGNENTVVLLERENAWTRARSGFEHIAKALNAWEDVAAEEHRDVIMDMVNEAKDVAKLETSFDVNEKQYKQAKAAYTGVSIVSGDSDIKVSLQPVGSIYAKQHVRVITKADGVHFSDLPEKTKKQQELKKHIAKSYLAVELSNILSGNPFDCDRHGQQMKVDIVSESDIRLNLYDYGGFDISEPSVRAKKSLGSALNQIAVGIQMNEDPISIFEASIEAEIDQDSKRYLMRTRKAWLALQDFQKHIEPNEMIEVFKTALSNGQMDADIMSGFKLGEMLRMVPSAGPSMHITREVNNVPLAVVSLKTIQKP